MSVFLGLDCGGTSTRAIAVDGGNTKLFAGQAAGANLTSMPTETIEENLRKATLECPPPDNVCACFAGLLDEDDRRRATTILKSLFPDARLRAEPDYVATLKAAGDTDVCVIAGTGSMVCSFLNGHSMKSGGRGHLLGDEGSAFQYGRDALRRFLAAPDQASAALRKGVEETLGSTDPNKAVRALYQGATPAATLARLSHALAEDAKAGKAYALRSVEENSTALANIVSSHVMAHFGGRK